MSGDSVHSVQLDSTKGTLKGLDQLRSEGVLCDVTLQLQDEPHVERQGHRVVLAAFSHYFKLLIQQKLRNSPGAEMIHIELTDIDEMSLDMILEFAYTGEVSGLDFLRAQNILPIVDKWGIHGLMSLCCQVFSDKLSPENCLGIKRYAEFYNCSGLMKEAENYALWQFGRVYQLSVEFLQLEITPLLRFLRSNHLNVATEDHVWILIKKWIGIAPEKRKPFLCILMEEIRYSFVSARCLVEMKQDPMILESPQALARVQQADDASRVLRESANRVSQSGEPFPSNDENPETAAIPPPPMAQPCTSSRYSRPRQPHDIIFAVGGWSSGHPTFLIESYNSKSDNWTIRMIHDAVPRAYHGLAELNGLIYVIGGYDGAEYFDAVRVLDPAKRQWRDATHMHVPRCYVSVAVLNGCIYAIGGFDGARTRLSSVERYDPRQNEWTLVAAMNVVRSDASAATLNGKIYVAGGFDGQTVLSSVECYDPKANTWTVVSPMNSPRSGVSLAAIPDMDTLMVIGGFDGLTRLASAEEYEPRTNLWTALPPMHQGRSNFATVEMVGMVYVLGGFNGITTVATVERYDPLRREWDILHDMSVNRSAVKAVVVERLSNASEYSGKSPASLTQEASV